MYKPVLMYHFESAQHVGDPVNRKWPRHWPASPNHPLKVGSFNELHGNEVFIRGISVGVPYALVEVETRHIWMLDSDHRTRFLLKALTPDFRIANQDFDGGVTGWIELAAAIDLALTAVPKFVQEDELVQSQIAAKKIEFVLAETGLNHFPLIFS
jgi:hypothetical protein